MNSVPFDFADRVIARVPKTKWIYGREPGKLGTPWAQANDTVWDHELKLSPTHYCIQCIESIRCEHAKCPFKGSNNLPFDFARWNPQTCAISIIQVYKEMYYNGFPLDKSSKLNLKRILRSNKRLISLCEFQRSGVSLSKFASFLNEIPALDYLCVTSGRENAAALLQLIPRPIFDLIVHEIPSECIEALNIAVRSGLLNSFKISNELDDYSEYCRPLLKTILEIHAEVPPQELMVCDPLRDAVDKYKIARNILPLNPSFGPEGLLHYHK